MRDGASTNGVAMRTLEVVYPKCMDIICFSHTIDRVGEHFCTPVLDDFITAWGLACFPIAPKCKAVLETSSR